MKTDIIYNEDCIEGMRRLPDASVDCIVCDLPYEQLHKGNKSAAWDRQLPLEPLWEQWLRVAKPNAAIVLFGNGMFTAQLMMSQPKLWKYNLIWEKGRATGFLNANRMPMRSHEDIAVFYLQQPTYNPQFRAGDSHPHGNGWHRDTNQCYGEHGKASAVVADEQPVLKVGQTYDYDHIRRVPPTGKCFPMSVLHFDKEHDADTWHATQKPVNLLRWLIRTYTNPGDVVLDCCMGSGTTAVAAIMERRHFVGYELCGEFYERCMSRVRLVQMMESGSLIFPE